MTDEQLIDAARNMLQYSYSPYSHFRVGAALLSSDGRVFTGCNIEDVAYGPSMCAERVAFFNAVSTGVRGFAAIAIVGGRDGVITDYCPPCGVCRQVMSEFCKGDFRIILTNGSGKVKVKTLDELLPERFSL